MPIPLDPVFLEFKKRAEDFGVELDHDQIEQFAQYFQELQQWNRVVRLVSSAALKPVVWLHFMDSLAPASLLAGDETLLDIGSGAGFPGIPLKIAYRDLQVHLVESKRRKYHFLRRIAMLLGLEGLDVHWGRIEQGVDAGPFETIISRAMASPRVWLPWTTRLLGKCGRIILMGSQHLRAEAFGEILETLNLKIIDVVDFDLPVVERPRRLVILGRATCFT